MSKARIHLDKQQVTKISRLAIGLDKSSKQLPRQAMDKLSRISDQLVGMGKGNPLTPDSIAGYVSQDLSKAVANGINMIHAVFKTGVQGALSPPGSVAGESVSWQPLSKDWIAHKKHKSKDLFWRNTGSLEKGFRVISSIYRRRLASEAYFGIKAERKVFGKPFWYRLTFRLPAHAEFNVFNTVIAESFLDGVDYSNTKLASTSGRYADPVIGYLEGAGSSSRHRPFISKVMVKMGQDFRDSLMQRVREADAKVNKRRGLTFDLKS